MIERLKEFLDDQEEGISQQFEDNELSEYINMALDVLDVRTPLSEEAEEKILLLRAAQLVFRALSIQYVDDYGKHQYYNQMSDAMAWQMEELLRGRK